MRRDHRGGHFVFRHQGQLLHDVDALFRRSEDMPAGGRGEINLAVGIERTAANDLADQLYFLDQFAFGRIDMYRLF